MTKYLVCWTEEAVDLSEAAEILPPIPCPGITHVSIALGMLNDRARLNRDVAIEWTVFEEIGGVYHRRTVTYGPGGRAVASIDP
jgi:hypothetical protein